MLTGLLQKASGVLVLIPSLIARAAVAQDAALPPPPPEVLISVADQRLVVLREGALVGKYRISTSKFGTGDSFGSYKTPLGRLRVCNKIGGDLESGAVIKHREATGEVLQVNARGRDPIVTRVIWLEGLEDENRNARARGIYIHGTPEESTLGKPASWGCIRMRSRDVIELYDEVPPETPVTVIADHLPRLHKYKPVPPPPAPVIIAGNTPAPAFFQKQTTSQQSAAPVVLTKKMLAPEPPHPAAERTVAKTSTAPDVEITERKALTDPGALRALKGSILLAGLLGAPAPADSSVSNGKTKSQP